MLRRVSLCSVRAASQGKVLCDPARPVSCWLACPRLFASLSLRERPRAGSPNKDQPRQPPVLRQTTQKPTVFCPPINARDALRMSLAVVVALGLARRGVKGVGRRQTSRPRPRTDSVAASLSQTTSQPHAPCASPPPRLGTPPYTPRQAASAGGYVRRLAGRLGVGWTPGRENKLVVCPQPPPNARHLDAYPRRTPSPHAARLPGVIFLLGGRDHGGRFGFVGWTVLP
jgi:hypothetical protein